MIELTYTEIDGLLYPDIDTSYKKLSSLGKYGKMRLEYLHIQKPEMNTSHVVGQSSRTDGTPTKVVKLDSYVTSVMQIIQGVQPQPDSREHRIVEANRNHRLAKGGGARTHLADCIRAVGQ